MMQDYKKLVEALRYCAETPEEEKDCNLCEYYPKCSDVIAKDAADAIEALNNLVALNTERCESLRKQLREAQEQYEKHLNELEKELSFSESTYEEFKIIAATQNALLAKENAELKAQLPHWVSVEERKPPEYTDVWCAVYTTDIIYVEDGETPEEAIENRQREAARNPRVTLGSYSEDEGWTDGYYGMPMVCRPDYWLEMTIPEPPKEDADANK